jgi:hypothetical protein
MPTTIPPTIPAMIPEKSGAPDASAIPRHSGTATKNTTILAGRSLFQLAKYFATADIRNRFGEIKIFYQLIVLLSKMIVELSIFLFPECKNYGFSIENFVK